ncbi:sulfotransferase family 2 domain-containing protein [Bosea sp. 117]|uniref:sulfotransferase family 2 domain-containing protein n=1 Tax=Bosea sp. 117 TaxID=1125973 RepID=UPI000691D095|nr:sulfotransferase family 2 domain-containing protein [Bosea sp. 117]
MICSKSRGFVFLKTRKTAGTSVELALRTVCGREDVITCVTPDEERRLATRPPQNHYYPHRRARWPLPHRLRWTLGSRDTRYSPHIPLDQHARAPTVRAFVGPEVFDSAFRFSIERNPWDRQVSYYFWRWRNPARRPPFEDWLRSGDDAMLDNWHIYTVDDIIVADRVLRYERLSSELDAVARELGLKLPPLPMAKSGHRPKGDYRSYYTPETRDLVAGWYAREIEAFGYDF